jgi:hypothetical protein
VSSLFWNRFCEQIDILYIHEESEIDSKKKPEILEMTEEVKKKITDYIQWNVIDEAKIDQNIMKMIEVLFFPSMKLSEIDFLWREFDKLKILDLSNNKISTLENTPSNLEELYLNSNNVTWVKGPLNKKLLHLGLAYNHVDTYLLNDIYRFYPNLFSLNVSHNKLIGLEQTVEIWCQFADLKILILRGNPCALVEGYKSYCINKLKKLRLFDVTPIPKDDSKKKSLKSDKQTKTAGDFYINNDVSFDLKITVLGGVQGTKITEENCLGIENFDQLEPQYKCSRFWVQTELLGVPIKSDVKLWDTEFMKSEESGKTDFKLEIRKVLNLLPKKEPSFGEEQKYEQVLYNEDIYDSLMSGMWVELYEEYPILEEKENAEGEFIKTWVVNDGVPLFKTAIIGITKINTENWLLNPNLNSSDQIIHNKFYFYKLKYKSIPEFFYDNHFVNFKHSEIEAIESYVVSKREKLAQQEQEEKEKAAEKVGCWIDDFKLGYGEKRSKER